MDALEKLKLAIIEQMRAQVPVQTVYATVTSTNVAEGTMECQADGVPYYDVLLGLGGDKVVPMVGSTVLLGLVQNRKEACFLIMAERIQERHLVGDKFGGVPMADVVANVDAQIIARLQSLAAAFQTWAPAEPLRGIVQLKALLTTWAAVPTTATPAASYQNPALKHG